MVPVTEATHVGPGSAADGHAGPWSAPLLDLGGVSKAFGSTQALDGVSITILPGRVHGLVGQNGSGKSTLVKILAGYHVPDAGGSLRVRGEAVPLDLSGGRSHHLGLRFVHQDLGVVPSLSVTENLFVDRFAAERRLALRWGSLHAEAAVLLGSFGVDLDPRRQMGDLPAATQAMVVIVRAAEGLRGGAGNEGRGVLVLDEATASLPLAARTQLRSVVREVVALGHGVLFVSHFPDEILEWADHVTVFRDGRAVADRSTEGMREDELVELIIGRKLVALRADGRDALAGGSTPAVLSVRGMTGTGVEGLDLEVRQGEVLGLTGLVGSGFDEVCAVLGGAAPARAGRVDLAGRTWELAGFSPIEARSAGIALVPQDRQRQGSAPALTVAENMSLSLLDRYRGRGDRLVRRELDKAIARLLVEYDVQPPDPTVALRSLSGGNQQKVVIAKAMAGEPSVLALVEPTQGVDVGARADILDKLRDVARAGTAVICATTDASQLEQLCDRVLVLQRGRIVAELCGDQINEDRIVEETYRSVA